MKQPTLRETALGVFLHDIGKFVQRANSGAGGLPPDVWKFRDDILPSWNGRLSHWHALWSEAFFQWMEKENLHFPTEIRRNVVRNVAVFHHKPDAARGDIGAAGWIAAEADRLASGMDRKPKDEEAEASDDVPARQKFIKTALVNPFASVKIPGKEGDPVRSELPLDELRPGEGCYAQAKVDVSNYPQRYQSLWQRFREECRAVCSIQPLGVFEEAILSLSERFLHAVPSSTMDQPDISLHDHSRAAAAIAAALYMWHESDGSLDNEVSIKDRTRNKFRFLSGDISGIQSSLFLLASQQVKGVNRILRARSFLMSMLTEAAALECRERIGLPAFSLVQNAGGRFQLLVPDTPAVEQAVREVRSTIEQWVLSRWRGELALNLALSPPFSGNDLMHKNYGRLKAMAANAVDDAKQRTFSTCSVGVHRGDRYPNGPCTACGVRPGEVSDIGRDATIWRCRVCAEEHELGAELPGLAAWTWTRHAAHGDATVIRFWDGLLFSSHRNAPHLSPGMLSAARVFRGNETVASPAQVRHIASYVPRMTPDEPGSARYRSLSDEAKDAKAGDLKQMEHIAADALEDAGGELRGQNFLAILKADVDRLGAIFSQGMNDPSLSRDAGLSRMMDFFFTGQLPHLLASEPEFRSTYTVYAGGDDLLLIGPWRQTMNLALRLRQEFARWTGKTPHVTLSAAVELMKESQPLNRSVHAAEERLERAKNEGRNRICAIGSTSQSWDDFAQQLQRADRLNAHLASGMLSQSFIYRVLTFDETRLRVESNRDGNDDKKKQLMLADANWRARWGYQLARNVLKDGKGGPDATVRADLAQLLNELLGLTQELNPGPAKSTPSARTAITVAVYRNRKPDNRS